MQYLVIAYDYEDALDKRMECRPAHVEAAKKSMAEGTVVSAGALIEEDKMIGSTLLVDFQTEEALDKWLENEPYVTGKVWDMESIQIVPVKLLPKD